MGIVRRQSALNFIWSYLGVGLGYVNKVILFSEILTRGQFGLLELLLTFMTIGAEISLLGVPKIITRFFPRFRGHPTREGSLMFFILVYAMAGFALLTLILLFFKPFLVEAYSVNSPLFAASYAYILPITLGYFLYKIAAGFSGSLFRSVIPMLSFEVVQKLLMTALIVSFYYQWFDFDTLVLLFVLSYFVPAVIIFIDIQRQRLKWKPDWSIFNSRSGKLMIQYGLFTSLSDATVILVQRVDMILIALLIGEAEAGTYAIAIYFSALIAKPSRSMKGILGPLIATRLKERNFEEVEMLYRKTALNNVLIGGILLVGLIVNIGPFFELLPKHAYAEVPAMILGAALLLNVFSGPHRFVILNTRLFKVDFYANIVLLISAILIDIWLIPSLGLTGAAIGTLVVTIGYNLFGMLYVGHHMKMKTFAWKNMVVFLLLAGITAFGLLIPDLSHPFLTMTARSVVVVSLFGGYMLLAKPSKELHELILMPFRKLREKFGTK